MAKPAAIDQEAAIQALPPPEFEILCAALLTADGYEVRSHVRSGLVEADILATKDGKTWAVECRATRSGISAATLLQARSIGQLFGLPEAIVITNQPSVSAELRRLAAKLDVKVWHLAVVGRLAERHPSILLQQLSPSRTNPEHVGELSVSRLTLRNYRGFSEADIEFHRNVSVIVGINGSGKSSILDAIAHLLQMLTSQIGRTPENTRSRIEQLSPLDIKKSSTAATIEIEVRLEGEKARWSATTKNKRWQSDDIGAYSAGGEIRRSLAMDPSRPLPFFTYYGADRPDTMELPQTKNRLLRYTGSYLARRDQRAFVAWFRRHEDLENEVRARGSKRQRNRELETVRTAISTLLPGISNPRFIRRSDRFVVSKNKLDLDFGQLSAGERSLIALATDLAWRMSIADPQSANPTQSRGVVLIDEPELHLHPGWQREALTRLRSTFPNIQFIVATHSPHVLSSAPTGAIRSLDGFRVYSGSVPTFGRDTNAILSETMNLPTYPPLTQAKLDEVAGQIDRGDFGNASKSLSHLAKELGDDHEVIRLRTLVDLLSGGK